MIRGLFFIVVVLALGIGFAWLADRPGEMLINWQGQQIELSLMTAVSFIVALIASMMFIWWVIRVVLTSPEIMSKYFKSRKKDRGYKALSEGLIAAGSGDATLAKKLTKQSKSLLDDESEPLIRLLDVQTAMIDGRDDDARKALQKMADTPETATLGLRGLYLEAKRLGAGEAARQYAKKAADQAPHLSWASDAAIEYSSQDNDWDDAIRRLEKQRTSGVITADIAKRKMAVLLAGRALSHTDGQLSEISNDGLAALKLSPDFVPAAIIAAKALFRQDSLRKGSKILEKVWKVAPHPQVADAYVHARVGDTAGDRLKRAKKLDALRTNHVESLLIVAKAALESRDFTTAREKTETAARLEPRESMYLLLADIEEAETGDQGRVRHWLAHAMRAEKDPQWTADGYISENWAPISPVTGKLDAFEWKVPLTTLATASGPITEGQTVSSGYDAAASALPALTIAAPAVDETLTTHDEIIETTDTIADDVTPEAVEIDAEIVPVEIEQTPIDAAVEVEETITAVTPVADNEDQKQDAEPQTSTDETPTTSENPDDLDAKTEDKVEETLVSRRFDDPGVDENIDDEKKKSRFKLF